MKKIILVGSLFFSLTIGHAQVDIEHLATKGSSDYLWGLGGGAFLELGIPLPGGDKLIIEPNVDFFGDKGSWVFVFPILAGYRHNLGRSGQGSRSGQGFYLQPVTGFTFGSTAIPKTNAQGDTLRNQRGYGFTAGLGLGYSFRRFFSGFSLELRYERIFVAGDPYISLLSLRYVQTISFNRHRRQDQTR